MTRLEASSEPSMEDILASIRKIISEDPPGSRPVPPAPRSQSQAPSISFGTAFERSPAPQEPQFEPAQDYAPSTIALTPEPYLRSTPSRVEPSAFGKAAAAASDRSFDAAFDSSPASARIEPAFAPHPGSARLDPIFEPAPVATAFSVEAQLSELLGDADSSNGVAEPDPAAALPQADFAAKLMGRPSSAATIAAAPHLDAPISEPQQRPGFTVSRDGYVPSETADATDRDPFDFDLGPSPFEAKTIAPVIAELFIEKPDVDVAITNIVEVEAATDALPSAAAESEPAVAETEPESHVTAAAPFLTPSVAATVPPFETNATAAVVMPPASLETAPVAPVEPPVASMPVEEPTPKNISNGLSSDLAPARTDMVLMQNPSHANLHTPLPAAMQRTMEDTVADLLRPMLKSWLAENMPKIVERALRREMSERNLSEHKTAAE